MSLRTAHSKRPPADAFPLLITYEEAARLLGDVSVRHIERLVGARKLRSVGRAKARRIVYQSILDYIEREGGNE